MRVTFARLRHPPIIHAIISLTPFVNHSEARVHAFFPFSLVHAQALSTALSISCLSIKMSCLSSTSRCTVVAVMLTMPSTTALQPGGRVAASHPRRPLRIAMLEPPFELPYVVPRQPKPFSDYEWDESCACTER